MKINDEEIINMMEEITNNFKKIINDSKEKG